jgi:hypothetical protein
VLTASTSTEVSTTIGATADASPNSFTPVDESNVFAFASVVNPCKLAAVSNNPAISDYMLGDPR